jgi:nucleotidyltransferase/DNA polymerase involved in DNA repair
VEKAGLDEAFIDVTGIVRNIQEEISQGRSDGITIDQIMDHAKRCVNRESVQHKKAEQARQERKARLDKWFAENTKTCLMDNGAFVPTRNASEAETSVVKRWIQLDQVPEWWCIPDVSQGEDSTSTDPLLNSKSFVDQSIVIGSHIAQSLRRTILNELGYTTGVGVAQNKMLAKVGSARNKPDQQTLIITHCIEKVMSDLPIGKIRFLGGKIGKELMEQFTLSTAGEAQQLSISQLCTVFEKSTAHWYAR